MARNLHLRHLTWFGHLGFITQTKRPNNSENNLLYRAQLAESSSPKLNVHGSKRPIINEKETRVGSFFKKNHKKLRVINYFFCLGTSLRIHLQRRLKNIQPIVCQKCFLHFKIIIVLTSVAYFCNNFEDGI